MIKAPLENRKCYWESARNRDLLVLESLLGGGASIIFSSIIIFIIYVAKHLF